MITPGCWKRNCVNVVKKEKSQKSTVTHLLHDFWKSSSLESNSGIPFSTQWVFHSSFKLSSARVRIRQIFHKVFSGLLISFLRDDDMFFVEIGTCGRIYAGYFLDSLRLRRKF
jgi:hypothetical protein